MSKKVVFIHGSPRPNGNTRTAAGIAMQELAAMGIGSDGIDAPRLRFKHPGCISCHKCQKSSEYRCHVDDELAQAVAGLPAYDAVVVATPIYWFSYTAQAKMVIDRMYSLIKFTDTGGVTTPLAGKPLGLLATGGGGVEFNLDLLEMQWKTPAHIAGCPFISCLIPFARYEPGELVNDGEAVDRARDFGRRLGEMLGGVPAR